MHTCTRLVCGLFWAGMLSLATGIPAVQAQEFITFNFTAEITALQDGHDEIDVDAVVGDEINGLLMYDPNMEATTSNDFYSHYDLGLTGTSRMVVLVGTTEFNAQHDFSGTNFREGGFFGTVQSREGFEEDEAGNREYYCHRSIQFHSSIFDPEIIEPDRLEKYSQLSLSFNTGDCDWEFDTMKLPRDIDLDNWPTAQVQIMVHTESGQSFSLTAKITSISSETSDGALVRGNVFADYNADCEVNGLDMGMGRRLVKFTPGSYLASTNTAGDYNITLPLGEYEAEIVERPLWSQACQTGPATIDLSDASDEALVNFGMQPDELLEAVDVSVMSFRARPGFELRYRIHVRNSGTLPYSGTLRFRHDELLTDFSSNPQADVYSAPLAEWNIVNLPVEGSVVIEISTMVPADETLLGTVVCAYVSAEVDDKVEDQVLLINEDEVCQEIRGAYDPNDIQVFVGTRDADGAISQDDRVLNYLIRFQNEGNESAITVRVVDALSEFHNVEKLVIGAASHDFEFDFNSDGALEWTFNDIDLVPKSVDEAASQGFIKFQVHLQDELAVGTEIPNKAAIYFDFNSPVITNTVVSRITSVTTSVEDDIFDASVSVYPNPTVDNVTIQFAENTAAELTLRNPLGEAVLTQTIQHSRYELDLRTLAAGSYYLTIKTTKGTAVKPISVVR